jgi:hypothetical protein
MNTQVSSIALFKTVIPASEAILSGKDLLGRLRCLRIIDVEIAGLLSTSSITADKRFLCIMAANVSTKLVPAAYVAVNLSPGHSQLPR